jgi:hypothetical protein
MGANSKYTVDFRTFPDGTVTLEPSNETELQAFGRLWDF